MVAATKYWKATRGSVILRFEEEEDDSLIVKPEGWKDPDKPTMAKVLDVGAWNTENGDPGFKVGDTVVLSPGAKGVPLQFDPMILSIMFQFVVAVQKEV